MKEVIAWLDKLQGKKTYLTGLTIFILVFGTWQGWWKIDQEIYNGLMAALVVFLRMGVAASSAPKP